MRLTASLGYLSAALTAALLAACGQGSEAPADAETTAAAAAETTAPIADATVAGTQFNATGTVPCARNAGQPTSACQAGVTRQPDGTAAVTVNWPGGGSRIIFFDADGKPVGFDANQADGSAAYEIKATKNADLNMISIGDERYEIPEVFVVGD